jgi:hypothetical protein
MAKKMSKEEAAMKRKWVTVIIVVMTMVLLGAGAAAPGGQFVFGQHAKQMAEYDAQMAVLKAKTAEISKAAAEAQARQDRICKAVGMVPVVGLAMRLYNAGEMKAVLTGKKNVTAAALLYTFFKLPASLPEHAATDFVYQFTGSNWRELDPVTVMLVYDRPYWADVMVTGTKAAFGVMGAYSLDVGIPGLGGHQFYRLPVEHAFLWMAAGGGGLNVLTGLGHQAAGGFKSFRQYYQDLKWWTGDSPVPPARL